jgi:hypothetical protein
MHSILSGHSCPRQPWRRPVAVMGAASGRRGCGGGRSASWGLSRRPLWATQAWRVALTRAWSHWRTDLADVLMQSDTCLKEAVAGACMPYQSMTQRLNIIKSMAAHLVGTVCGAVCARVPGTRGDLAVPAGERATVRRRDGRGRRRLPRPHRAASGRLQWPPCHRAPPGAGCGTRTALACMPNRRTCRLRGLHVVMRLDDPLSALQVFVLALTYFGAYGACGASRMPSASHVVSCGPKAARMSHTTTSMSSNRHAARQAMARV